MAVTKVLASGHYLELFYILLNYVQDVKGAELQLE